MIKVSNLNKTFIKYEKEQGLKGMVKGFFNAKKVRKVAVNNIDLEIKKGEIVGYIGSNGAGKSTTIKMLTGIMKPTSGTIKVNGLDPYKERKTNAKNIGVVFGQRTQLWWDLPLVESFSVLKEIYNVSEADFKKRMRMFDEILGINEFIKSPVRTLSLGQRMKADIVASLLHNPKILYLDEPTIGLDVLAKENMRSAIKKMNEEFETTVILTTHDLEDIEELCDRIIIIDNGNIIYDGTIKEIKDNYGYMRCIKFEGKDYENFSKVSLDSFKLSKEDLYTELNNNKFEVHYNKNKISVADISKEVMSKVNITDMGIFITEIEEVVKKIYIEKGYKPNA